MGTRATPRTRPMGWREWFGFAAYAVLVTLFLMAGMTAVGVARAAEPEPSAWWLNAGGVSYHTTKADDAGRAYSNSNPGLGLERDLSRELGRPITVGAGAYRNSLERTSLYVGVRWMPLAAETSVGRVALGLTAGVASNYGPADAPRVVPVLLPTATFEHGRFGLAFQVIPPFEDKVRGAVFAVQFRARL
jgi:hypothetical protein